MDISLICLLLYSCNTLVDVCIQRDRISSEAISKSDLGINYVCNNVFYMSSPIDCKSQSDIIPNRVDWLA